ncbi:glutamyl/glutaminyl-tRNA synthetase [Bradyrhizobium sp. LM6.11]
MSPPVFRFAPSPNGYLHLGHAYSALLNSDRARDAGGRLLLRIEDIDATRCRPEFETAIYEDLAWLDIAWETPVRRQSEHLGEYRAALDRLSALGVVYPAFGKPRRDRKAGCGPRSGWAMAARSRRRAALSRRRKIAVRRRARAAHRHRCALCASARHGGRLPPRRRPDLERAGRGARW